MVNPLDATLEALQNIQDAIEIMQYMGVLTVMGTDYVATWHVGANSEQRIACKYPEIIQNSFGYGFDI